MLGIEHDGKCARCVRRGCLTSSTVLRTDEGNEFVATEENLRRREEEERRKEKERKAGAPNKFGIPLIPTSELGEHMHQAMERSLGSQILGEPYASLFRFKQFNPVQSKVLEVVSDRPTSHQKM